MALPAEFGVPHDAMLIARNPLSRKFPSIREQTRQPELLSNSHLSFLELAMIGSSEQMPGGTRTLSPQEIIGIEFEQDRHTILTPKELLAKGVTPLTLEAARWRRQDRKNVKVGSLGIFDTQANEGFYRTFRYMGAQFGIEGTPIKPNGEIAYVELSLRMGGGGEQPLKKKDFSQLVLRDRYEPIFTGMELTDTGRIRMAISEPPLPKQSPETILFER